MAVKKYIEFLSEEDQHRKESDKDIIINQEIDSLQGEEPVSEIEPLDLSPSDIDKLSDINESVSKSIIGEIKEILIRMATNEIKSQININHGEFYPEEEQNQEIFDKYSQEIYSTFTSKLDENYNSSDIDDSIIDEERERRSEELEDSIEDNSRRVFNTVSDLNIEDDIIDDVDTKKMEGTKVEFKKGELIGKTGIVINYLNDGDKGVTSLVNVDGKELIVKRSNLKLLENVDGLKKELIEYYNEINSNYDGVSKVDNVIEILNEYNNELNGISIWDKKLLLQFVEDEKLQEKLNSI